MPRYSLFSSVKKGDLEPQKATCNVFGRKNVSGEEPGIQLLKTRHHGLTLLDLCSFVSVISVCFLGLKLLISEVVTEPSD